MAFDLAEKNLGIPKLLDVQDMVNVAKPDERSIIVYISEFVHYYINQLEKKPIPSQTTPIKVVDEEMDEEEEIPQLIDYSHYTEKRIPVTLLTGYLGSGKLETNLVRCIFA